MLTTIFCIVDDFCKEFHKKTDSHFLEDTKTPRKKRVCRLSESEIITILIYYHFSKYKTFKDYYNILIRGFLSDAFDGIVSYNRFVELAQRHTLTMFVFASVYDKAESDKIYFIDSISLKVCHNKRISSNKVFKNIAKRGKTSMGWFFGFKLHFIINSYGEIVNFILTSGNVSDKNEHVINNLTKGIKGKIFGDKGYISSDLFKKLLEQGIKIITKIRKNMKNCFMNLEDRMLLRKRGIIESVGNILKNYHSIEHSRHRNFLGFIQNVFSAIAAYHLKPNKPNIYSHKMRLTGS